MVFISKSLNNLKQTSKRVIWDGNNTCRYRTTHHSWVIVWYVLDLETTTKKNTCNLKPLCWHIISVALKIQKKRVIWAMHTVYIPISSISNYIFFIALSMCAIILIIFWVCFFILFFWQKYSKWPSFFLLLPCNY